MSMGWERDVTSKFAGHGVLWGGVVVEHLPCSTCPGFDPSHLEKNANHGSRLIGELFFLNI
jgi:hypothetical protein